QSRSSLPPGPLRRETVQPSSTAFGQHDREHRPVSWRRRRHQFPLAPLSKPESSQRLRRPSAPSIPWQQEWLCPDIREVVPSLGAISMILTNPATAGPFADRKFERI